MQELRLEEEEQEGEEVDVVVDLDLGLPVVDHVEREYREEQQNPAIDVAGEEPKHDPVI